MKKTTIAATAAAALFGAFVCLPSVRGQNGAAAGRAAKSPAKASPAAASGSSATPKIACLDLKLILREYKKLADKKQEMAVIAQGGNAKIQQIQAQLQELGKGAEKLDRDSDEFRAREKKAFQLDSSMKACKTEGERAMKLQSVKATAAVYQDVQAALKLFSEQNGYTLVVQIDREANQAQDYRMIQSVALQQVVYYRQQEDISVAVLSYLNDRYAKERAEAGFEDSASPRLPGDEPTRSIPVSPNRKRSTP